jgi:hypothetical protein
MDDEDQDTTSTPLNPDDFSSNSGDGSSGNGGGGGGGDSTPPPSLEDMTPEQALQYYKDRGWVAQDATDLSSLNAPVGYTPDGGVVRVIDFANNTASDKIGLPAYILDKIKAFYTGSNNEINWGRVAATGSALAGLAKLTGVGGGITDALFKPNTATTPTGYQGGIPSLTAVRQAVPGVYNPSRRPGSAGQRYFTDVAYATPADVGAAQAAAQQQATGLAALNAQNNLLQTPVQPMAKGGVAGRYLNGPTDGMEDKLETTIDGGQEARLSHGEFVMPADIVSHLGNGNSDAGARRLYDMMDRIRKARTGTTKQGKQIKPEKYLPA